MTESLAKQCDEVRLNHYLDGELGTTEIKWMEAHLNDCADCRKKAKTIVAFTQAFRQRVEEAAETVDFVALEKGVLQKTLPRYISRSIFANVLDVLKFLIPIALITGFLLFFIYTRYIAEQKPSPGAIIESFSGKVDPVIVFETENRDTVIWFNEETDQESGQDAL